MIKITETYYEYTEYCCTMMKTMFSEGFFHIKKNVSGEMAGLEFYCEKDGKKQKNYVWFDYCPYCGQDAVVTRIRRSAHCR